MPNSLYEPALPSHLRNQESSAFDRCRLARSDLEYLGGITRDLPGRLLAAGGMPDHVHLLVGLHPSIAVADALRQIKTGSSKWIHETLADQRGFGWQDGYGAFAVSLSQMDAVRQYIARQEDHHRRQTFEAEFIEFLERHGISYDPRYLWT